MRSSRVLFGDHNSCALNSLTRNNTRVDTLFFFVQNNTSCSRHDVALHTHAYAHRSVQLKFFIFLSDDEHVKHSCARFGIVRMHAQNLQPNRSRLVRVCARGGYFLPVRQADVRADTTANVVARDTLEIMYCSTRCSSHGRIARLL